MRYIDDKQTFREWLLRVPPDYITGRTGDACCCPLAGFSDCVVHTLDYVFAGENKELVIKPLPEWAVLFISAIDKTYVKQPVTAQQALDILDSLDV